MRAAVVERVGSPPAVREVPEPERGEGQAVVRVRLAAVNPIDLAIASGGFWAGVPEVPYVPGREGVGEVVEGGGLPAGARVWFSAAGGYGNGSLTELAAVDEDGAIELPDGADETVAACLGIAAQTAWLALDWRGRLSEGETVLVLGASGALGQVAVQGAKLLGAGRVVAAARDPEGLARARELGADAVVELSGGVDEQADAFRDAAGGDIDLTIDPLWGSPAVAAVHAAARGGRVVQLGQSAGAEATIASAQVRGKKSPPHAARGAVGRTEAIRGGEHPQRGFRGWTGEGPRAEASPSEARSAGARGPNP